MQKEGGQAVSHIVDAHVAYCTAISELSRDKTELLERIKRLEAAGDAILNANDDDEQYEAIKQWYKAKEAKP
jgi:hypothetical protein